MTYNSNTNAQLQVSSDTANPGIITGLKFQLNEANAIPLYGLLLAAAYWFIDVFIRFTNPGTLLSFSEHLLTPEPTDLLTRLFVIIVILGFSLLANRRLLKLQKTCHQLILKTNDREQTIKNRSAELESLKIKLKNERSNRKETETNLKELATTDPLTHLYNRRKYENLLTQEISRSKRYTIDLSVVFCDIDHFKQINDNYGHMMGDEVLIEFSKLLKNNIREADTLARWGGEEFIILAPNTEINSVILLATKLQTLICEHHFPNIGTITASFGTTCLLEIDNASTLVERADKALYQAKHNGRNRVETLYD